jgi:hypothetical protein
LEILDIDTLWENENEALKAINITDFSELGNVEV